MTTTGSVEISSTAPPRVRHFTMLGTTMAVSTDSAGIDADVTRLLAGFTAAPQPVSVAYSLRDRGTHVEARRNLDEPHRTDHLGALDWLLADMNRTALERYGGFAVHAAVVAVDELAICFPGPSGAGKSTMAAACVLGGLDYVSDEAMCVDRATARVAPYPRPLALSDHSMVLLRMAPSYPGESLVPVAELGGSVVPGPVELAHIVLLERDGGPPRLERLYPEAAMSALLDLSFNLYKDPESNLELAAATIRGAATWRLHHRDPLRAADWLVEHLDPRLG